MNYKNRIIGAIILLLSIAISATAQTGVQINIYEIESSEYPEMWINFSAYNRESGSTVGQIATENLEVTLGNGTAPFASVGSVAFNTETNREWDIMIMFDLTASVDPGFVDEQKEVARNLIARLDFNDRVGISIFSDSNVSTGVVQALTSDTALALERLETLQIISGDLNRFRDGLLQTVQAFGDSSESAQRAVIVLTDLNNVEGRTDQSASIDQIISEAQHRDIRFFMVGFADADASILRRFSSATNSFTYLPRENEIELTRLGTQLADVIRQEYVATIMGQHPVNPNPISLTLSLVQGQRRYEASTSVLASPRPLTVVFESPATNVPLTNSVTFDARVAYSDDIGSPSIATVVYTVNDAQGQNRQINPENSSNLLFEWSLTAIASGNYNVQLTVTDQVGNTGQATKLILVAGDMTIDNVLTEPPISTERNAVLVNRDGVTFTPQITSDFDIRSARLLINGEVVEEISTTPFRFQWKPDPSMAGSYTARIEVENVDDDAAFAEIPLIIELSGVPIVIAIGIVLLFVLILVAVSVTRLRTQQQKAAGGKAAIYTPPPYTGGPAIVVTKPKGEVYPLEEGATTIGRARNARIHIQDTKVSRTHAQINGFNNDFVLNDMGAANPSRVNGEKVQGSHRLGEGDRIEIGNTELLFTFNAHSYVQR